MNEKHGFDLTPEELELQNAAIQFARSELIYDMVDADSTGYFNREAWNKCAAFGLFGTTMPREFGGMECSPTALVAVMEGLGYVSKDQGLLFSANAHLWTTCVPILRFGTDEQKRKYLPRLISGEFIGANATTESDAGSDAFSMRTRAERKGDFYVLNGSKLFVTNAGIADLLVVYATLNSQLGLMGITGFLVERGTTGMHISKPAKKMGLRTSPMAEVHFVDCKIPVDNRLGREGRGAEVFEYAMEWERGCILATCLGTMRRQLEQALAYARSRKQFGKPIGQFQSVANRLVDMKVRLDICRLLIYRFVKLKEANVSATMEAAISKLYVSESYVSSSLDALRINGGYGFMTEQEIERDLRDSIGSVLYSGTSDIQRNIIAKRLGL